MNPKKKEEIDKKIAHHPLAYASPSLNCEQQLFLASCLCLCTGPDMLWYGVSLWPGVFLVTFPNNALSWLILHLLTWQIM